MWRVLGTFSASDILTFVVPNLSRERRIMKVFTFYLVVMLAMRFTCSGAVPDVTLVNEFPWVPPQSQFQFTYLKCVTSLPLESFPFGIAENTGRGLTFTMWRFAGTIRQPAAWPGKEVNLLPNANFDRIGAFYCTVQSGIKTYQVTTIKMSTTASIKPVVFTKTVNAGDTVTLEMQSVVSMMAPVRWRHNNVIIAMATGLSLPISGISTLDEGIYECYYEGTRTTTTADQGVMRLIVRSCPADLWGPSCQDECPGCYNGGVCDPDSGECVCPPGFTGANCDEACPIGAFGQECNRECAEPNCAGRLLCLPDPYGCSCIAGYQGPDCDQECVLGTFGAGCTQQCNCRDDVPCDRTSGFCVVGCPPGWEGNSCQRACDDGRYGDRCESQCHCVEPCDKVTGTCGSACLPGWRGVTCGEPCPPGRFGANCMSFCRCLDGEVCDAVNGTCPNGCRAGWKGDGCQDACETGEWGSDCEGRCFCQDNVNHCNLATGPTPDCQCDDFHFGEDCMEERVAPFITDITNVAVNPGEATFLSCSAAGSPLPTGDDIVLRDQNGQVYPRFASFPRGNYTTNSFRIPSTDQDTEYYCAATTTSGSTFQRVEFTFYELPSFSGPPVIQPINIHPTLVIVDWTAWNETIDVGEGPIRSYQLHFKKSEDVDWLPYGDEILADQSRASYSRMVMRLDFSTEYDFSVQTFREGNNGGGPLGPVLTIETKCMAPTEPPQGIQFSNTEARQTTVSWQLPPSSTIRCKDVISFQLLYRMSEENAFTTTDVNGTQRENVLIGLQPYTSYDVKMSLANSVGTSPFSEVLTVRTQEDVPGPVSNLTTEPISSDSVQITWSAPVNKNGRILAHLMTYRLLSDSQCPGTEEVTANSKTLPSRTTHALSGLQPYSTYEISLRARTLVGPGPEVFATVTTLTATPSGPPINVTIEEVLITSILVSWLPPACPQSNGVIIQYGVSVVPLDAGNENEFPDVMTRNTRMSISGLRPSAWCGVRVRAYTDIGPGPYSPKVNVTTLTMNCSKGTFGVFCELTCHCLGGEACDRFNGSCLVGCAAGWTGTDCQEECSVGWYGPDCSEQCHCLDNSAHCNRFTGPTSECECNDQYFGNRCLQLKVPPNITALTNSKVNPGQPTTVFCAATGNPTPTGTEMTLQLMNGTLLQPTASFTQGRGRSARFSVTSIRQEDILTCIVNTIAGSDEKTVDPLVYELPQLVKPPTVLKRDIEATRLTVSFDGWTPNIDLGEGPVVSYIVKYRKDRDGNWNSFPSIEEDGSIEVHYQTIAGLTPYTTYDISVQTFRIGEGGGGPTGPGITATTKCLEPTEAPVNLRLGSVGARDAAVLWDAPDLGTVRCREITGFRLYWKSPGDFDYTVKSVESSDRNHTLSNLAPFSTYNVKMELLNEIGPSPETPILSFKTPEDVPQEVRSLTTSILSPTIVGVSWDPPVRTNGILQGYDLSYNLTSRGQCSLSNSTETVIPVSRQTTNYIIQGLFPYSTYQIAVSARTSAGVGNAKVSTATTQEAVPSGSPLHIRATQVDMAELTFSWDPTPCEVRNGMVLRYDYIFDEVEAATRESRTTGTVTSTGASFSGLRPDRLHMIKVRASTSVGAGPYSIQMEVATLPESCPAGFYGNYCNQSCYCMNGGACERITGYCSSGCANGYTGDACNQVCPMNQYGPNCTFFCNCMNPEDGCDRINGPTQDCQCTAEWFGANCTRKKSLSDVTIVTSPLYTSTSSGFPNIKCVTTMGMGSFPFGVAEDTGTGTSFTIWRIVGRILPEPWPGRMVSFLPMAGEAAVGAFYCEAQSLKGIATRVTTVRIKDRAELLPEEYSRTVSVGESVTLAVTPTTTSGDTVKWMHNGVEIQANGFQLNIDDVQLEDAGLYECFYEGQRTGSNKNQAMMRLIVRGCPPGLWGNSCEFECPECYNGGQCFHESGECVCPPGFKGTLCEKSCGGNRFGMDCSQRCDDNDDQSDKCSGLLLCVPDPYGCSCTTGLRGHQCDQTCQPGTYGAGCTQQCNCRDREQPCDPFTGNCESGCPSGWHGDACQQKCEDGTFGEECAMSCNCMELCDHVTGQCPAQCEPGWRGDTCQEDCVNGTFGHDCEEMCHCLRGEACDVKTGECHSGCAAGWTGLSCQESCPVGRFGPNCSLTCHCYEEEGCDSFHGNCSRGCGAGWKGESCQQVCNAGEFGPDCGLQCHCLDGGACDILTGKCEKGCGFGWTGEGCQEECREGRFGPNCTSECHCADDAACDLMTGTCPGPCASGWSGMDCQEDIDECESSPCENDGTCVDDINSYTCTCPPGYGGDNCQSDIDECLSSPCLNGGTCTEGLNHYSCDCPAGYEGHDCETEVDECLSSPCNHGGTCTDQVNGFNCSCAPGLTGHRCEININECKSSPCQNSGTCLDKVNFFKCACPQGFGGELCQTNINDCAQNPCMNNGTCEDAIGSYQCVCPPGFEGNNCELDVDDCVNAPCDNGGTCMDGVNSFECICTAGFTGDNCSVDIDECSSTPCEHGGTCEDGINAYTCTCTPGYEGNTCQNDVDECLSGPCENGGSCVDGVNSFMCECTAGYEGETCQYKINECESSPCQNNGTCVDQINSYLCLCAPGFQGQHCEIDIDECLSTPCQHSGTCVDRVNSYICLCLDGYEGTHCGIETNECMSDPCQNGGTCTDGLAVYACTCPVGFNGLNCENNIDDCSPNPCMNRARCVDGVDSYTCDCAAGFDGEHCEIDVNECESSPCYNRGTCTHGISSYFCTCTPGFHGDNCEIDVDDCDPNPCTNGGRCIDGVTSYSCSCPRGFTGQNCQEDVDECLSNPCQNNGTCRDGIGFYACSCVPGFEGQNCDNDFDECSSDPCQNGGLCDDGRDSYICNCHPGFNGTNCEHNIDDCSPNPCKNGGQCMDGIMDYNCTCLDGFNGRHCENNIDDCSPYPCLNDGSCEDGIAAFICHCPDGFEGQTCETDIDECESSPCQNGGTCEDQLNGYSCNCTVGYEGNDCEIDTDECASTPCLNDGQCQDGVNFYRCLCPSGFLGDNCETDVDECMSLPCLNGGTCVDGIDNYNCTCPDGYTGHTCETDIDECESSPCLNGGTCTEGVNAYNCSCPQGFEGQHCDKDIDECMSMPCLNNGSCVDGIGIYTCLCIDGYTGQLCETDIDECLSNPCDHGGTCKDGINEYFCHCLPGYEGTNCQNDTDDCASHQCLNGGSCVDGLNNYSCSCLPGFEGDFCEIDIDECSSDPCHNGGTCQDSNNSYTCHCGPGYEGTHCNTDIDECSSSPCANDGTCTDQLNGYLCLCTEGFTGEGCEELIFVQDLEDGFKTQGDMGSISSSMESNRRDTGTEQISNLLDTNSTNLEDKAREMGKQRILNLLNQTLSFNVTDLANRTVSSSDVVIPCMFCFALCFSFVLGLDIT
ncbi:uncharacterized protein LOC118405716 [Branchiostoma floridae]|uniref:Uncharacterized protein LOC118405716 n=1 Tax=Branchiostoma floridae TaxID=7739 RepID=A0A9J7HNS8_BRAFL|nr:uncharacterized protein LOC118405716 [Branchiostoma floridae]